ncbi:hypothetical protein NIES4071_68340 [Calothrix sp. NIES-4071]|nr:hypothetical protein NIES4071_68340 [Calothrix sp. NIES-4071]BAZ61112.1 hypothetical protein NIES4105_68300 [Calothrix sp. NIES-4105]
MRRETNICLIPKAESQISATTVDSHDSYYDNYYGYTNLAIGLLTHYSFDLGGYKANELIARWQIQFPLHWLHLAAVEALYQGRYKAVSVEQILTIWLRRGQPSFHFNMEFERLICSKFPQSLTTSTPTLPALPPVPQTQQTYSRTLDKNDTSNQWDQDSINNETEYKNQQNNSAQDWGCQPPIPNIEVVEHKRESHAASQLVKMAPLVTTYHPAIEQFTPKTTDVSESFASKLKSIIEVKSAE